MATYRVHFRSRSPEREGQGERREPGAGDSILVEAASRGDAIAACLAQIPTLVFGDILRAVFIPE